MLIHAADIITEIQHADQHQITLSSPPSIDTSALVTRVNQTIQDESTSIEPLYEKIENITYFKQSASFIKPHTLKVGNETLYGEKIVIAAGARPKIPQIPGLKDTPFWTSTDALQSTHIPKSMVILGGGYIACELGYYLQRMGASVTYCARTELIRQEDEDIKEVFNQQVSTYARIINHTTPTHISHDGEQFTITLPNETLVSEGLLVATGVTPYSDTLALENTDIETDEHGFIKVNDHLETNTKNHYAFGDIIGRYLFRHNANFEGDYLFNNTIKEETKKPIVYPPMPHAVFTYPQSLESDSKTRLYRTRHRYCRRKKPI